jgi:23S rRNA (cytosine1962-C5)-methyltransferase
MGGIVHHLAPGAGGQVGYFPEQEAQRRWIREILARANRTGSAPPRLLNLFAFTGGTTLAAAKAGAHVTHVDSQRAAVTTARRNAIANDLPADSIRWIVEDARLWVEREIRRGSRYDAIALDPPSFGRGTGRRAWKLERDLDDLLVGCAALLTESPILLLATAHTEGMSANALQERIDRAFRAQAGRAESGTLEMTAESGARLFAGVFARRDFDACEEGDTLRQ